MTEPKKRAMWELLGASRPPTDAEKLAGRLEQAAAFQRMAIEWEHTKGSPEWKAMEKLEAALRGLRADPEITASEPCTDLLDMMIDLLDRAWPHHDVQRIVAPMKKHFDGVKSKDANEKRKEILTKERNLHHSFLDQQHGISDTVRLAARLRKNFNIQTVRGSEDAVRFWKKLRATGKT